MQTNNSSAYRDSYLSQPFDVAAEYPDSFDGFKKAQIGEVPIADIPNRIKERHLQTWGKILNMDPLTTPLSHSIRVAKKLYMLLPHVKDQPGDLQAKADIHHALIRLTELWKKFEEVLQDWARTEVGAHANAADGLTRLEEARFMPELARFTVILQGYGEPGLFEEIREFVATSMELSGQIETWLYSQGVWLL